MTNANRASGELALLAVAFSVELWVWISVIVDGTSGPAPLLEHWAAVPSIMRVRAPWYALLSVVAAVSVPAIVLWWHRRRRTPPRVASFISVGCGVAVGALPLLGQVGYAIAEVADDPATSPWIGRTTVAILIAVFVAWPLAVVGERMAVARRARR